MAMLHNKISHKELKERLHQENIPRVTISFYKYFPIDSPREFRDNLYKEFSSMNIFGRVYVASEGINAQVSVPRSNMQHFESYINSSELRGVRFNFSVDDNGKSFWVLKIKVRDKIVADGISDPGFDMEKRGRYVSPEEFNHMVQDPATVIVDMRNHYEYEVGHFRNAIEIPSDTFKQQLPMAEEMLHDKKDQNIIMYCTGGIRCEKASAYLKHRGFKNVHHLEGGIINYVNTVKEKGIENHFVGKNFVFDDRLGERVGEEIIARCHQCGKPADTHVNCANEGCHLLFIQCKECAARFDGCCSEECKHELSLPVEQRKEVRKGRKNKQNIFNKSRSRLRQLQHPDRPTI